ncbi:long-chain-fatty-acid--CoA ligase [Lichenicoccus sp.]|uniref:long-chain-fatty-acid--CoA ligase n=1 Tax=Lichenicoccus sp. TaxID=2781899 RepID=UPI003D118815
MLGLMQDWPLTLDRIIDYAATRHATRVVVTRSIEGPIVRSTYAAIHNRAKRLSSALLADGIAPGDRVATLGFNTARHLEAWYGTMGIGVVCHTINPRLHVDQICWIVGHAEDRIILADPPFVPLLLERLAAMPSVRRIVVLADALTTHAAPLIAYEDWIRDASDHCDWGRFSEETAAGLCYTSGTTGNPKGVLYSHRSNFLHALMAIQPDVMALSATDVVLPVVPMFHANGWGLPFAGPAVGAKMVMPGAKLDGASLHELIETEGVTFSAAVPTVWQMLLAYLDETKQRLSTLKRVLIGGAACPESMIRAFHDRYGVDVVHAWGMTETSPLGSTGKPAGEMGSLPFEEQIRFRVKQGRPPLGIDLKIVDEQGRRLDEDGRNAGYLRARGGIVARAYFGNETSVLDEDGFFDTGDVASIDADGFMQITDRSKDIIKSGGEWISSVEIENIAAGHPKALLAAVVGVAHPKWGERPLLLVQLKPGESAEAADFIALLDGRIAKWWMPDEVRFVPVIPLGATGKIDKKRIRAQLSGT